jgi:hypothetical protein
MLGFEQALKFEPGSIFSIIMGFPEQASMVHNRIRH